MPESKLLGDDAAARESGDVGRGDVELSEDAGGVIGHHLHRDRPSRHRGPARPPVVERRQPVAVGEAIELELPRLDGVSESADKQDVRSSADLLGPDVEVAGAYVLTHC
jgi:hypothetical protein